MKNKNLILLSFFVGIWGCGTPETRDSVSLTDELKLDQPENMIEWSAAEAGKPFGSGGIASAKIGNYFNRYQTDFTPTTASCLKALFDSIIITVSDNEFTLEWQKDTTDCSQTIQKDAEAADPTVTPVVYNEVISRYLLKLTCDNTDLSQWKGKTASDFFSSGGLTPCVSGGSLKRYSSSIIDQTSVNTASSYRIITTSFLGTTDKSAINFTIANGVATFENGATVIELTDVISAGVGSSLPIGADFKKFVATGIIGDYNKNSAYFNSGNYSAQINNWKGQIYFSGAQAYPTFSLNNGLDTILNGTIGYTAEESKTTTLRTNKSK